MDKVNLQHIFELMAQTQDIIDISPPSDIICSLNLRPALATSGSTAHLYFVAWLINNLKPALTVELVAEPRDMHLASCESIEYLNPGGRCLTVSVRPGMEESQISSAGSSSAASPGVEGGGSDCSRANTPDFATVADFQDGVIDLLLFAGSHSYEVVKHDFAAWLPKLSPRGVVLCTGICESGDSGVRRFWEEVRREYPSFSFTHGLGLGMLAAGGQICDKLSPFFAPEDPVDTGVLREYFARIDALSLPGSLADGACSLPEVGVGSASGELEEGEAVRGDAALRDEIEALRLQNSILRAEEQKRVAPKIGWWKRKKLRKQQKRDRILLLESGLFDTQFYLDAYPEVKEVGIDPVVHYLTVGWKELKDPSSLFSTGKYLSLYQDVLAAGLCPLLHYVTIGKVENRDCGVVNAAVFRADVQSRCRLLDIDSVAPCNTELTETIGIHAHIFYPDLLPVFCKYLSNMPFSYDLYVSVPSDKVRESCLTSFGELKGVGVLEVRVVPNKGRDIAPFVCEFGAVLQNYDFILHMHSKKSLYNNGMTSGWLEYFLNGLLGSKNQIRRILSLLRRSNSGLVYPQTFERVPAFAHSWLANAYQGQRLLERLGLPATPSWGYLDFSAGSMFWARGEALRPLFELGIKLDEFPSEAGQTDGTMAHALERVVGAFPLMMGCTSYVLANKVLPSWSRWRLDSVLGQKLSLEHTQKQYKVVAFDIFDTLLSRPFIQPEITKQIIAENVGILPVAEFVELRHKAEASARERLKRDVGLDDIYAYMHEISGLSEEEVGLYQAEEERAEAVAVVPRDQVVEEIFKPLVDSPCRVILISDMFLPRKLIEQMLADCGISGWDELYLSSDIGLRKDGGKLYKYVLKHEKVKGSKVLMIGDNPRSDYQLPTEAFGLHGFYLLHPSLLALGWPRFEKIIRNSDLNNIDENITVGLIIRRYFNIIHAPKLKATEFVPFGDTFAAGYSVVGPLILAFVAKLTRELKSGGYERVYFLARDAEIVKMVFDLWNSSASGVADSKYLVVSRRALSVPLVETFAGIEKIARIDYCKNSIAEFLVDRFGVELSETEWAEVKRDTGWSAKRKVGISGADIDHILPLLHALEDRIYATAREEKQGISRYLAEMGVTRGKNAVVDIGYAGSIQRFLCGLTNCALDGYYFITDNSNDSWAEAYKVKRAGLLYDSVSRYADIYRNISFRLEKWFSSDMPQVVRYDSNEDGSLDPVFREVEPEEVASKEVRDPLREGIIAFVEDAIAVRDNIFAGYEPSSKSALLLLTSFFEALSADDAEMFEKLILDDHYCGRGLV